MKLLRNIFELLKEFVSLPRRAIFLVLGVWALGWLIREYFLFCLSEGAILSVRSASRLRLIDFTVDYYLLLAFFYGLWIFC
jgi:hypothetical protein